MEVLEHQHEGHPRAERVEGFDQLAQHPLGEDHRGFLDLVPTRVTEEQIERAARTRTPELLLTMLYAGSIDEVVDEVAPLVDAGCRHFTVANVGAMFTGEGARGLWRVVRLTRRLRRVSPLD